MLLLTLAFVGLSAVSLPLSAQAVVWSSQATQDPPAMEGPEADGSARNGEAVAAGPEMPSPVSGEGKAQPPLHAFPPLWEAPSPAAMAWKAPAIDPEAIRVYRDQWGVPHIHGPSDASVAYGLAWSNAEDAFAVMQETVLTGKGMMGRLKGKDGVIRDYLLQAFDIPTRVQQAWYTQLSSPTRDWLDGYAQGLNAYAAAHPEEVLVKGSFPVTAQELLQGQVFVLSYMVYAMQEVEKIFDGAYHLAPDGASGSNAYALAPSRTQDGKTYLAINPHQPLEGPFSFYECHLISDEGLNFHGAMYHNGMLPGFGSNADVGWAMTYNKLDLVDSYVLDMHPSKRLQYRLDGEWKSLEKRRVWLTMKTGPVNIRIPRTLYWSAFGPTFKKDGRFYAVRFGMLYNMRAPDQLLRMLRARGKGDLLGAMRMLGIPRFNMVYADRNGNIGYVDNGQVPQRPDNDGWKGCRPGTDSRLAWEVFMPFDSLPQVHNPKAGYVFNTNNTPFLCTADGENLDSTNTRRFPPHAGYSHLVNNRALRFTELIASRERFGFEAFKAIKFDQTFPACSPFLASCEGLFNLDPERYPHLAESLALLNGWDKEVCLESHEATLFALTIEHLFAEEGLGYDHFFTGFSVHPPRMAEALEDAQNYLMTHFDRIDVPWGDIQRLTRGAVDLPLPGYFDLLAANYSRPAEDGRFNAWVGDAYTQFVVFGPNGLERMETLLPFGASVRPESPHFTDQMALYVQHKTKPMGLDLEWVRSAAVRDYTLPTAP
jgi:acyl-homoserine-lactone acylase